MTRWPTILFCSILLAGCGASEEPDTQLASSSSGPGLCTYPSPPYGQDVGEVLAGNTAWEGFPAHSSEADIVDITSFYDCDGSAGVNALLFVSITFSCIECQPYLSELESLMSTWEPMGASIVVLLGTGANGAATITDVQAWKTSLSLNAIAIAADPNFSLILPSDTGYPNQVLVDPRTMQVVHRRTGFDDDHSVLEQLLADNKTAM